jgi:hypothetical protein
MLKTNTPEPEEHPTEFEASEPGLEPTPILSATPEETSPTPSPSATIPPVEVAGEPTVRFSQDVLPILESRCVQCHDNTRSEGGLLLNSYQAVMAGSSEGPAIIPGDSAHSILVELIVSGRMPRRGPGLTPGEIEIITRWVDDGALDN